MKKTISFEINEKPVERMEEVVGLNREDMLRIYSDVQKTYLSQKNTTESLRIVLKKYKDAELVQALIIYGCFEWDNDLHKKYIVISGVTVEAEKKEDGYHINSFKPKHDLHLKVYPYCNESISEHKCTECGRIYSDEELYMYWIDLPKQETNKYNCGGIVVELTLPKGEHDLGRDDCVIYRDQYLAFQIHQINLFGCEPLEWRGS